MTVQQEQHRQHLERLLRVKRASLHPKVKAHPTVGYEIPNTPFGVPKISPYVPPKIADSWVDRQKKLHSNHKEPWFSIEEGPRYFNDYGERIPPRIEFIQREVCKHFGITRHDMLSGRRTKNLVIPRHVVFYLSRRLSLQSLPGVGRKTGGRDHTTVLHGIRRINAWLPGNERLQASIEMLVHRLGGDPE